MKSMLPITTLNAASAALKRTNVVETMQETTAVADGLAVMAQAYILLEMNDLAEDTIRVLCVTTPRTPTSMATAPLMVVTTSMA